MCGTDPGSYKDYALDQNLCFTVADREHPITAGIEDFTMKDEAYLMGPSKDSQVLLTTAAPNSMPHIAWVKEYNKSRVFCYQSGHGPSAWDHPVFRELVRRGILWATRQGSGSEGGAI
jgi:type 1 glutamine amidotransferase